MSKPCHKCGRTERDPRGRCRPCKRAYDRARRAANPEKGRASDRARYAANPEKIRARERARITGWTPEMVDFAWELQEGKCLICNKVLPSKQKAHTDHCHDTDKRRWLLCRRCNTLEGMIKKFKAEGHSVQRFDDYLLLPGVEEIFARRSVRGDVGTS
jgi:hypothetical protein